MSCARLFRISVANRLAVLGFLFLNLSSAQAATFHESPARSGSAYLAGKHVPGASPHGTATANAAEQPKHNPLIDPSSASYTAFAIGAEEIVSGDAAAPITVISYLSPECGHCSAWLDRIHPLLQKHHVETGNVRHILRFVRLTSPKANPQLHAALERVLAELKSGAGLSTKQAVSQFKAILATRKTWTADPRELEFRAAALKQRRREAREQPTTPAQDWDAALAETASDLLRSSAIMSDEIEIYTFWRANTREGERLKGSVPVSFVSGYRAGGHAGSVTPVYHVEGSTYAAARRLFQRLDSMIVANRSNQNSKGDGR